MKKGKYQKSLKNTRMSLLSVDLNEVDPNPESGEIRVNLVFNAVDNEYKILNADTGEIIPTNKEILGYKGENKTRTLVELPKDPNDHSIDLIKKLGRYDNIVAIDTNTAEINGQVLSVGVACQIFGPLEENNQVVWKFPLIKTPFIIEGKSKKPENENWKKLIEFILNHKNHNPKYFVGIVVDSDLGNITQFNNQEAPIFDDFFLPNNFELIFASDKAMDSHLNAAIKHCHSASKKIIEGFIKYKP